MKVPAWLIGAIATIALAVGGWWISRVEEHMKTTDALFYKDFYLNGSIKEAPVRPTVTVLAKSADRP